MSAVEMGERQNTSPELILVVGKHHSGDIIPKKALLPKFPPSYKAFVDSEIILPNVWCICTYTYVHSGPA